jgi:4,5-dihydroxyphthalate decarboxylase
MASALSDAGSKISLAASLTPEGLVLPIVEGKVAFDGVDLALNIQKSIDKNSRAMIEGRFELCEMSLATFVKARLEGLPIVALPAFTGRRFLQPMVVARAGAGIRTIQDLAGKRVGLPQYWMTSSVWHRGVLEDAYGIAQEEVEWVTTATERLDRMRPPPGVTVRNLPEPEGPFALLERGQVDCVMMPKLTRRAPGWTSPFTDLVQAQTDYFRASRIFPIMHLVVMSQSVARRHPELPSRLMAGLVEAKRQAEGDPPIAGLPAAEAQAMFGADPYPYGLEANRATLETFIGYAHRQGLIAEPVKIETLFA